MSENPYLIRVLEIAPPTGEYCHGGGYDATFREVDWFKDSLENADTFSVFDPHAKTEDHSITTRLGRENLTKMIKARNYYDENKEYLVLCPMFSFTINYKANPAWRIRQMQKEAKEAAYNRTVSKMCDKHAEDEKND